MMNTALIPIKRPSKDSDYENMIIVLIENKNDKKF